MIALSPVIVFFLWVIVIFLILAAVAAGLIFIGAGMNEGMDQETNEIVEEMKHKLPKS